MNEDELYYFCCDFCGCTHSSPHKFSSRCPNCNVGFSFNDSGRITLITYTFVDPEGKFYGLQISRYGRKKITMWISPTLDGKSSRPATFAEIVDVDIEPPQPSDALALTRRLHNLLVFS